jgi:hypothetical protein
LTPKYQKVVFMLSHKPSFLPFSGAWIWTVVAVIQLILVAAGWGATHSNAFLHVFGFLVLGQLAVPWAIEAGSQSLLRWIRHAPRFIVASPDAWENWAAAELQPLAGGRILVGFGFMLTFAGVAAYVRSGVLSTITSPTWFVAACIVLVISSFFSGIGIGSVFLTARMVWRAGRFAVRVTSDDYGITSTGFMLGKVSMLAAIVWTFFTASVATVGGVNPWIPILVCAVPAALLFLASFLVSQIPMHLRMIEFKHCCLHKLDQLSPHLEDAEDAESAAKMIAQIKLLDQARAQVAKLPDWPFHWGALLQTTASSSFAILPSVVHLVPGSFLERLLP